MVQKGRGGGVKEVVQRGEGRGRFKGRGREGRERVTGERREEGRRGKRVFCSRCVSFAPTFSFLSCTHVFLQLPLKFLAFSHPPTSFFL